MKKVFLGIAIVLAIFLGFQPLSHATPTLRISDGTTTFTITDGGVGDACAGVNCVTFSGTIGDWNINVSTGTTKEASTPLFMDLNSVNHHSASTTASTMTIEFSDIGFTQTVATGLKFDTGGTISAGGTATFAAYVGTNSLFNTSNQIGSTLTFTTSPFSGATTESPFLVPSNPYSLYEIATITFGTAAGQASFDAGVNPVPEPATLILLGLGLAGTALYRRKRSA